MQHSRRLDQIAIALSAICIVHCLAVPILIAALPVVAVTFGVSTHFHELMLWLVVPTSVAGFAFGYRIHERAGIVAIGAAGLAGIAATSVWGHDAWPLVTEVSVSVLSSLVLGYAHLSNFRAVRVCHAHD